MTLIIEKKYHYEFDSLISKRIFHIFPHNFICFNSRSIFHFDFDNPIRIESILFVAEHHNNKPVRSQPWLNFHFFW